MTRIMTRSYRVNIMFFHYFKVFYNIVDRFDKSVDRRRMSVNAFQLYRLIIKVKNIALYFHRSEPYKFVNIFAVIENDEFVKFRRFRRP